MGVRGPDGHPGAFPFPIGVDSGNSTGGLATATPSISTTTILADTYRELNPAAVERDPGILT
ncbi:MAG TPA: hypothetical protein VIJ00_00390 [Nakamurella sp.]